MNMNLTKALRLFKTNHQAFQKLMVEQRAEIERQHAQQLATHRRYDYGAASIAFLENADGILKVNIQAAQNELLKIYDDVIVEVRETVKQEAERIRASQAEKRHRLRVKTTVTVPADKAAAMQAALASAKKVDEVIRLHEDALAAKDEASAYWLEQNAGARIAEIGKEIDQARWEDLCEREYKRRGGTVLREIEEAEDDIRTAESAAHRYLTSGEALDRVSRWGGQIDDWLTVIEDGETAPAKP